MRILVVGDVVGKPGRQAVARLVPALRREHGYELVVCNGENAAGGNGLTRAIADELRDAGCDVVTNGNHVWDQRQFVEEIKELDYCLRPLNLDAGAPGRGWLVHNGVLVANAIGRVFMAEGEKPHPAMERPPGRPDGDPPRGWGVWTASSRWRDDDPGGEQAGISRGPARAFAPVRRRPRARRARAPRRRARRRDARAVGPRHARRRGGGDR